ncbi:hypothetical protein GWA01_11930 [Gluconobacter wancherniae NBRC 103581]|uniref:Uncharacterized protein n=1 Tax=Gluconobacter wancherniae NBRC 103581 TaxID=656744 RepID=A0A511B1D7_9PROT|nr:hypothetical protein GWA01_11930 [Gluconobacter wancherniae NBRC 103581]
MLVSSALAAEPFRCDQQKAVEHQEARDGEGISKYRAQGVLEKGSHDDGRDSGHDKQEEYTYRFELSVSAVAPQNS